MSPTCGVDNRGELSTPAAPFLHNQGGSHSFAVPKRHRATLLLWCLPYGLIASVRSSASHGQPRSGGASAGVSEMVEVACAPTASTLASSSAWLIEIHAVIGPQSLRGSFQPESRLPTSKGCEQIRTSIRVGTIPNHLWRSPATKERRDEYRGSPVKLTWQDTPREAPHARCSGSCLAARTTCPARCHNRRGCLAIYHPYGLRVCCGESVYFHTDAGDGHFLRNIRRHPVVCRSI